MNHLAGLAGNRINDDVADLMRFRGAGVGRTERADRGAG
jgi:hypothetical protein